MPAVSERGFPPTFPVRTVIALVRDRAKWYKTRHSTEHLRHRGQDQDPSRNLQRVAACLLTTTNQKHVVHYLARPRRWYSPPMSKTVAPEATEQVCSSYLPLRLYSLHART
jgi:hypothetical protein